jgi:hypothetical protein
MKKFKTLFIVTLIVDVLAFIPILLIMYVPSMKEGIVYNQFPGMSINPLANELFDLFNFVFAFFAISILVADIVAIGLKTKETAQIAALLLLIIHVGWMLPDLINLIVGNGHPPIFVLLLSSVPVIALAYGWKKGEMK